MTALGCVNNAGNSAVTKRGLVLSGGGARGAYQVGVLKAISEMHEKHAPNPFSIITGTSAGAINAVALAASANNFRLAVRKVERLWNNLQVDNIYKAGSWDIMYGLARIGLSLFNSGVGRKRPLSLLDNSPLRDMLSHSIQFRNIQRRIDAGCLDAVGVSATGYSSGESVTFFQGREDVQGWRRNRRLGLQTTLGVEHLLASSAIPMIFPPERISREYFGDGALRQLAPVSPALRMGADRIMVIGVSGNARRSLPRETIVHSPSMANMVGHLFNSAFIDSLEHDLDIMRRFNDLIGMVHNDAPYTSLGELRLVNLLAIYPSVEFDTLAEKHVKDLPRTMRRLMSRVGATEEGGGGSFASYLLFEPKFIEELIDYGYRDAMAQREAIHDFFLEDDLAVNRNKLDPVRSIF